MRFCLETFLDLALKIQHAAPVPRALDFSWVFDDVITPRGESADLFVYEFEGPPFLQTVKRRKVVRTLRKGEKLRCSLSPSTVQEKPATAGLESLLRPEPTLETADVLSLWLGEDLESVSIMYVERNDVEVGAEPKSDDFARENCPHLFPPPRPG